MLLKACAPKSPALSNSVSSERPQWPSAAGALNGDNAVPDGLLPLISPLRGFDELGRRTPGSEQLLQSEGNFAEHRGFGGSGEKLIAAVFWKAIRIWRRGARR